MQTDEVMVFMGLWQHADIAAQHPGSRRMNPHTSFVDPTAPVDALGRRSVDARVLCAFPKKKMAAKL